MSLDDYDLWGKRKRKRTLTSADKKRIAAKQGWKCRKCKQQLPARFHVDHIKAFAKGGSDTPSNLQALCPNCHARKTENERHRAKQKKIREKEGSGILDIGGGDLFGPAPKRRRRAPKDIFDLGIGPKPKKKKSKKKKKKRKDESLGFGDFGW